MSSGPNNSQARGKVHVYAIIRYDADFRTPESRVSVKEVLPTLAEAKAEVERLNAVAPQATTYFWQTTRFYPRGRNAQAQLRTIKRLRVVAREGRGAGES